MALSPNYTERQKKLITSSESERHFKIQSIKMNHNWAQISYSTPYQKHLKKQTLDWVRRGHFSKITENCSELGTDNSQYGGYIIRLWNWMNSYWMLWTGGLSWRFSASSFCDFFKMTFNLQFHRIFLLFDKRNPLIFQMWFIRRTIAYLCPNMINFDEVDFSDCRSEEVISFFWRSVYIAIVYIR